MKALIRNVILAFGPSQICLMALVTACSFVQTPTVRASAELGSTIIGAHQVSLGLHYSHFDFVLPAKVGLQLAWLQDPNQGWEAEITLARYSLPSLLAEFGSVLDQRITLARKSQVLGGPFHISWGLSHLIFSAKLGSAILSRLASAPRADVLTAESIGLHLGAGSRWTWSFANLDGWAGIDWLSLHIPVWRLSSGSDLSELATNEDDRSTLDTAGKVAAYLPRGAALRVVVGFEF
jgi:hypothetical protein